MGHPRLLLGGGIHGLLLGLLAGVDALPQHRRTAAGKYRHFQFADAHRDSRGSRQRGRRPFSSGCLHVRRRPGGDGGRGVPRRRHLLSRSTGARSGRMDKGEGSTPRSLASVPRNSLATIHSLSGEPSRAVFHPRAHRRSSGGCAAGGHRMTRSRVSRERRRHGYDLPARSGFTGRLHRR